MHPAYMKVKVVNVGRRLVILRLRGGHDTEGHWGGRILGQDQKGVYLKENEFYEETLHRDDAHLMDPEGDVNEFVKLWFEDTRGKRHSIKNSKKNLKKLLTPTGKK